MKVIFVLWVLAFVSICKATTDKERWENFKLKHGKSYSHLLEEKTRFDIFQKNLRKIQEHNKKFDAGEISWKMAINQFSDLTEQEFRSTLSRNMNMTESLRMKSVEVFKKPKVTAPQSVDWRDAGAVTEVKNQGKCGGCWSFSATGSLEGQYFLTYGQLLSFSEQNLLDCATDNYNCYGCDGGFVINALAYVRDYGIELENSYPYAAAEYPACYQSTSAVQIRGYTTVNPDDERALMGAVGTVGPVSIGLNADEFQMYGGGVYYSNTCNQPPNHAVLAVGYASQEGYWIVKNSWGPSWGEDGYIRIAMGYNLCGIASQPCYPNL